ncbi:MAG: lactate utilization protein [Candidatus Contendobacter sp.]|nr:lactate utilization protein [Candidatus Contendobacter sp.]
MNNARTNILTRLRAVMPQDDLAITESAALPDAELSPAERVARLKQRMEAMHAEVIITDADNWVDTLKETVQKRALNGLLYAPTTTLGAALEVAWDSELPPLVGYAQDVEQSKDRLFAIDAGITSTHGALADVGALILWPDSDEPRLMSLAPAVHIAVLDAAKIHDSLAQAIAREHWREKMPTNILLISGPSKTADIELVLTFGVHGPKELIVLILDG